MGNYCKIYVVAQNAKRKGVVKLVNTIKLKAKMVENEINVEELAKRLNIDRSTLYRKINSEGDNISIKEAELIGRELSLTLDEVNDIFFSQYVAHDANGGEGAE